ncbi:serine hydrolase [Nakamurella endophytica]|uniref:Beta-lactamase-related domain-containing protein n=1 Tax=Nakamurella endophytica TaxID=1748367 RepID=A0A917T852_9ACTN|nr:hypothetical protein GCM10011594_35520 [Nakamurella endophytica]
MDSVIDVPIALPGSGYGWGIARIGPQFYGHTGELPGYNSYMGHDPVDKATVVVWSNLAPGADGKSPASVIAAGLIDRMYGTTNGS